MQEEKKKIIQMVENGSLSAEEAIILLESLENTSSATGLSTTVDWQDTTDNNQKKEQQATLTRKFTDFVEGAIKKVKEVDFDLNFGPSFTVNHIFQQGDASFSSLFIDIANGDIRVVPWTENDVRIECVAQIYKVNNQDQARKAFLKEVAFSVKDEEMKFSLQKKQMKVQTVFYIPTRQYEEMKLRMFNGSISGENLSISEIKANTANGKVSLDHVQSREMEIETVNGHIKVTNITTEVMEAESLNGSITIDGSFERVDVQSFSGSISCHSKDDRLHTAFLQSRTGNVVITVDPTSEIDASLKTNFGKFICNLSPIETSLEKSDMLQKEWKFVFNKGVSKRVQLEAETKAGSIYIN